MPAQIDGLPSAVYTAVDLTFCDLAKLYEPELSAEDLQQSQVIGMMTMTEGAWQHLGSNRYTSFPPFRSRAQGNGAFLFISYCRQTSKTPELHQWL